MLAALAVPHHRINLDPAAEDYEDLQSIDLDCRNFCTLPTDRLGPNGALLAAMEELSQNKRLASELQSRFALKPSRNKAQEDIAVVGEDEVPEYTSTWYIFDLPGQAELFTSHDSLREILQRQLVPLFTSILVVGVADATACGSIQRYLSVLLLSLTSMLYVELPMLHVMTKIDAVASQVTPIPQTNDSEGAQSQGKNYQTFWEPLGGLEAACTVLDALELIDAKDSLTRALTGLLQDYSMVSFIPVAVEDKQCMLFLWRQILLISGSVRLQSFIAL